MSAFLNYLRPCFLLEFSLPFPSFYMHIFVNEPWCHCYKLKMSIFNIELISKTIIFLFLINQRHFVFVYCCSLLEISTQNWLRN